MTQLTLGTDSGYETAMRIYSEGAFTEPIAHINLTSPLIDTLIIGDKVIGSSEDVSREIRGSIIDNYPKGSRTIRVKYDPNEMQSSFVGCQVAANPQPKLEGCKYANPNRGEVMIWFKATLTIRRQVLLVTGFSLSQGLRDLYRTHTTRYKTISVRRVLNDLAQMRG